MLRNWSIGICALGCISLVSSLGYAQESAETPAAPPVAPAAPAQDASAKKPVATDDKKSDAQSKIDKKISSATTSTDPKTGEQKRKLVFFHTPWKDVIDDLADWADLNILSDKYPPGTCFHRDHDREYTAQEAIDELNGQLLIRGYTLIVYQRDLIVRDLADVLPDDVIPLFLPEELDGIGKFRIARCLFSFTRFTPQEVEAELRPVLSNWAKLQVLPKARQVLVTETGEKLRKIRDMLADDVNLSNFKSIQLKSIAPDEALVIIRVLMRFPLGQDSAPDGSISVAPDLGGNRLLVTGTPDKLKQLDDIIKVLDPAVAVSKNPDDVAFFDVYPIISADPANCLKVLETQLVGFPGVRIGLDSVNDSIMIQGTAAAHKVAKEALDKLQGLTRDFAVIPVKKMSAENAKTILDEQFGNTDGTNKKAPNITANTGAQQLFVRGTSIQIAEVRSILSELDVMADDKAVREAGKNVRTIPLTGRSADRAIEQLDLLWGHTRKNRIKYVYPNGEKKAPDGIRSTTPSQGAPQGKQQEPDNRATGVEKPATSGKLTKADTSKRLRFVSWQEGGSSGSPGRERPAAGGAQDDADSDITVTITPYGIIISGKDTQALDDLETMLLDFQNQQHSAVDDFTVIYLKHSKAEVTSELLREIIGGADAVSGGGGGGLLGNMMQGALGQTAGNMMSGLMSGGSGSEPSAVVTAGPVTIVPDTRLNALFVQAAPVDLDLVEQLVAVMDQQDGPQEPLLAGEPRVIRLVYAKAEDVAATIKSSLPSDLFAGAQQSQNQQPNPLEVLRALQGGGGRGGRNSQQRQQERPKITIGTDVKNNWLVVTAPDNLYGQVEQLAIELDAGAQDFSQQAIQIVRPKKGNGTTITNALVTTFGLKSSGGSTTTRPSSSSSTPGATTIADDDAARRARERAFQPGGGQGFQFPAGGAFPGGAQQLRFGPGGGGGFPGFGGQGGGQNRGFGGGGGNQGRGGGGGGQNRGGGGGGRGFGGGT